MKFDISGKNRFKIIGIIAFLLIICASAGAFAQNFESQIERKEQRDAKFFELAEGVLDLTKIEYRSRIGDMQIPAYVFQPLEKRGINGHPALIWVHGGVHGDLDPEHYWPFIKEAIDQGYVVIAPEYRGSTGYGKDHYEAIDYGGYEVDDCVTAVDYMRSRMPHVDTDRVGMIGFSHGGFITLHSLLRNPGVFKGGAAMVPVTNLVFRLSYKGPRYQRGFTSQKRIGGLPHERKQTYIERSPFYQVEKLEDPLIVHLAENDTDVNFEEAEMLAWKLMALKSDLAEVKIYKNPPGFPGASSGGHTFNRRVDVDNGYVRLDSWEQRDSWNRIWAFFDLHLKPYMGK
ncbi:alpha/beta hydrolase family protein [candidate division KSB1 bacterium]